MRPPWACHSWTSRNFRDQGANPNPNLGPNPNWTKKALSFAANDAPIATNGGKRLYTVAGALNANEAATYCAGGDALCTSLLSRSPCAKISQYATSTGNSGRSLNPMYMNEIFYKVASLTLTLTLTL